MREFIYWYIRRPLQKLQYKIAWAMPRWLAYYCTIRVIVHATTGKHEYQAVPELSAMDALKHWEE